MKTFFITVQPRSDLGKGASRRLRKSDLVPGIVYGNGLKPESIKISHKDFSELLANPAVANSMLEMACGGEKQLVVLRDLQRHPFKARIVHFDLQRINPNEAITMHVPLVFLNAESAPGVKIGGGLVSHLLTSVELRGLPAKLPDHIEVDLGSLELNDSILLSQLTLPEGVELVTGDAMVATVYLPKEESEEPTETVEAGDVPTVAKGKEDTEEEADDEK